MYEGEQISASNIFYSLMPLPTTINGVRLARIKFVVKNTANFSSLLFDIRLVIYCSVFLLLESYISRQFKEILKTSKKVFLNKFCSKWNCRKFTIL